MSYRYYSTKTYGHNSGLSCAFRQWKADSHCHFIHGYPIKIELVFGANDLDARNWVVDFGSLKSLKGKFEDLLDHKTLVAEDDPHLDFFKEAHALGVMDVRVVPATGMECLAEYLYGITEMWLRDAGYWPRVGLVSVQVWEHDGNSAFYAAENLAGCGPECSCH